MQLITGILTNTPIWVWVILAFLVYRGWLLSRTRNVSARALMVVPAIFIGIMLAKLIVRHAGPEMLLLTAAGLVGGILAVALLRPASQTRRLPDGKLHVRGEWISLGIFIAVFLSNYSSAVLPFIDPTLVDDAIGTAAFLNGFSVGFMTFRSVCHLRVGQQTPLISFGRT